MGAAERSFVELADEYDRLADIVVGRDVSTLTGAFLTGAAVAVAWCALDDAPEVDKSRAYRALAEADEAIAFVDLVRRLTEGD